MSNRYEKEVAALSSSLTTEIYILTQLRLEYSNAEERKLLIGACSGFSDICNLPGDKLSSTGATQHSFNVELGREPINTRPCRLPEAQKEEVNKQVQKLLQEGIIEESDSPWNSSTKKGGC